MEETVPCPKCGRPVDLSTRRCAHDGFEIDSSHIVAVASTVRGDDSKPTSDDKDELLGLRVGTYILDEVIGRGGMGTVYAATHVDLGNRVAIKLVDRRAVSPPEAHERFFQEARAAARIGHDNIVRVIDFARHPKAGSYMVLELLKGKSLAKAVSEEGPLDIKRSIAIAKNICDALAAAHAHGIVHRDLKPGNVFLTRAAGVEVAKVMDFGVAKISDLPQHLATQSGALVGTPLYMSPEQWEGESVDARTDVYALGVMLYEMTTGRVPISGGVYQLAMKVATVKPTPPRTIRDDIPKTFEDVILRCLEKKKEDRFASMEELAAALKAVDEAQAIDVRTSPRKRRRFRIQAAIFVVAGALVGGAVVKAMHPKALEPAPPRAETSDPREPPPSAVAPAMLAAPALGAAPAPTTTGPELAANDEKPDAGPAQKRTVSAPAPPPRRPATAPVRPSAKPQDELLYGD